LDIATSLVITAIDSNKAVKWYTESSEKGNSVAMFNLGMCYKYGDGVDMDKTKGFELFEQSALLGSSGAMNNVAYCYETGEGVMVDLKKAKEWSTKAHGSTCTGIAG
jgi:TPR repeat protein